MTTEYYDGYSDEELGRLLRRGMGIVAGDELASDAEQGVFIRLQAAGRLLMAESMDAGATETKITLDKCTYAGEPTGDWEVIVRRTDTDSTEVNL